MAVNSIVYSGIGDLGVAAAISGEVLELLADRRALPNHPALKYVGRVNDLKSNVIKVSHRGLMGYDIHQLTAEGSAVANTALTDGSSNVTVVRYSKAYSATDLSRIVSGGVLDASLFAQDCVQSSAGKLVDLVANLVDGFTLTAGTTGVNLTGADVLVALGTADINELVGPFMGMLHGQQWSDLSVDIGTVTAGGALPFMQATGDLLGFRGQAYKGSWLGVDFYVFNRVVNDGTDKLGGIFGPGSILWGDAAAPLDDPSNQMAIGNVLFERVRDGRAGETAFVSHSYMGASIGIQNGITLKSDN